MSVASSRDRSRLKRWISALIMIALIPMGAAAETDTDNEVTDGDPLQSMNRGTFWFNDTLDVWVAEPAARGWYFLFREPGTRHLGYFFSNLEFPVRFTSTLLQGHPAETAEETGRFIVNSTVGLAGFFDPATGWGLEKHEEDMGLTFGHWRAAAGAYLVLPFFGPSGVRDGLGFAVDSALQSGPSLVNPWLGAGLGLASTLNTRARILDDVEEAKESSLDYYAFVRNAYRQYRDKQLGIEPDETEEDPDDLYEIDDDE